MATALFVCLHNAERSQMSAALFGRAAQGRHVAPSPAASPTPPGACIRRSSRSCPCIPAGAAWTGSSTTQGPPAP